MEGEVIHVNGPRRRMVVATLGVAALSLASTRDASPPPLRPLDEYWDYQPAFSPDGRRIAFCSSRGSHPTLHVWVMDANGSGARQLTDAAGGHGDCFPAWSPDGTRIAFTSDRSGNRDLWVMNADGSSLRQLTHDPANDGFLVSWSPDGRFLAFQSDRHGDVEVYRLPLAGGPPERVTSRPGYDGTPAYSPDGRHFAYVSSRGGATQIWIMDADGGNPRQITDLPGNQGDPAWLPDGGRVAFYSDSDDPQYELYSIATDGSDLRRLTHSPNWDLDPNFSPDGRMTWHSSRNGRYGVTVGDADGRGRRRLTNPWRSDFVALALDSNVDQAMAAYTEARVARPDTRFVLGDEIIALVHELGAAGRQDEAVRLAEFGFDLVRDSTEGFEMLARAYGMAGRVAPPTREQFHALLRAGRYDEARAGIERGLALRGRWWVFTAPMLNRLGYGLLARGDTAGAMGVLALYPLSFPEDPNGWDSLADAEAAAGRLDEARAHRARSCALARELAHPATETFCRSASG